MPARRSRRSAAFAERKLVRSPCGFARCSATPSTKLRTSARRPAHSSSGPTSSPLPSASACVSRANRWRAKRKDHHGTSSRRRSTASTSPSSSRNRPRSTVENTSRLSSTPSVQRAESVAASSLGRFIKNSRRGGNAQVIGDPAIEIGERQRAHRLLFGHRLLVPAQPASVGLPRRCAGERRGQAENYVYRLGGGRGGGD